MKASNPLEERIAALIEPLAADMGYVLVRIRVSGMRRKKLQIMAERAADGGMGIEDCEALSHAIGPALDVEDPIAGEYDLEISSPGIDRPLVRLEDFARFTGHEARLELMRMIEGRRRFRGIIQGVEGEDILFDTQTGPLRAPFSALAEARLVLTDKLIEADLKRAEAAQNEMN
ncbi:MAG: ribosome maturation factor RimP [Hyphomonadaceae bacterium]